MTTNIDLAMAHGARRPSMSGFSSDALWMTSDQLDAYTQAAIAQAAAKDVKKLYIVMNAQGSEGVVFDEKQDAEWTRTGQGVGSSGFGVSCLGAEFRECYGDGKLTLHEVSAAILATSSKGGEA